MKTIPALLAAALLAGQAPKGEPVLENAFLRASVEPVTGAIASVRYEKATTFPLIADKGAGIAGTGALGMPTLDGVEVRFEVPRGADRKDEMVLRYEDRNSGVKLERTMSLSGAESAVRITDRYRAEGREVSFRPGGRSRLESPSWRTVGQAWYGDVRHRFPRYLVSWAGGKVTHEAQAGPVFWRVIGPYGVGFLSRIKGVPTPVTLTHVTQQVAGSPVEFEWQAGAVSLAAGKELRVETLVLVDEGGREGNSPAALAEFKNALVTVDLRAAGTTGETLPAFATVVSSIARKAKLVLTQLEPEEGAVRGGKTLANIDLTLEPGKGKIVPFDVTSSRKGPTVVEATLLDDRGEKLAAGSARAAIDGEGSEDPRVWPAYLQKIPAAVYKGTWAEIGARLAKEGRLKPQEADGRAGERLQFYEKRFPHYAEMIRGAAKALSLSPDRFACADMAGPPNSEACMNIFFNGPDGPINAFSKERHSQNFSRLAYMKVIPDKGYAYHVYECASWQNGYGVNSEGLSTTGTDINCDAQTQAAARKTLEEWKASGKMTAPLGQHMILAMCKDVDEAIRFIENPEAPFEFGANMTLVDRAGNAARLESWGITRRIYRYEPRKGGFFTTGNYPHETKEGLFKLGNFWQWGANTMMRERLLSELAGGREGKISLKEAFSLMETHAAGGMCQHGLDNIGGFYTCTNYIAVCRTSDLWLSHGPPCRTRYYKFSLKEGE